MNEQTAPGFDGDGLSLIVDIRVCGNLHTVRIEGFKHHNGGPRQSAGIQGVGQFHSAFSGFRRELHLSGPLGLFFAHQQGFACGLVHQDTGHLVSFSGSQTRVSNHVNDGNFPSGLCGMLPIHGGSSANVGAFLKGHGLVLILNIGMGGNLHITKIERFENYNRGSGKLRGIQGVGQLYGARGFFRGELHLSSYLGLLFAHQQRLPSGLVHQDTGHLVSLAGGQARVGHHIHDGDFAGGFGSVLAVHGSGSADFRFLHKVDGLPLIFNILMAGDFRFSLEESFKNNQGFPFQPCCIESKQDVHSAIGFGRDERGLRSHLLVVHLERFACGFVHEHTL